MVKACFQITKLLIFFISYCLLRALKDNKQTKSEGVKSNQTALVSHSNSTHCHKPLFSPAVLEGLNAKITLCFHS